jgi:hypothetical protein
MKTATGVCRDARYATGVATWGIGILKMNDSPAASIALWLAAEVMPGDTRKY